MTRVAVLQSALNMMGASLKLDGVLGPKTIGALKSRGMSAESLLGRVGKDLDADIERYQIKKKKSGKTVWISHESLLPYVEEASRTYGLSKSRIVYIIDLEAETRTTGDVKYYNLYSQSHTGRHFGLMQLSAAAWKDAVRYDRAKGVNKLSTGFRTSRFDPRMNILAGTAFVLQNRSYADVIHGYRGEYTREIDYALYNQGHSFIKKVLEGKPISVIGTQSPSASAILIAAKRQLDSYRDAFYA